MVPEKEKKYSRAFAVQEYLYRVVARSSPDHPERVPSERDISKDFDVARTTVRNAIADVESSGSVIRLPGRKGLFTNPEHSNQSMKFIAMIFLEGECVAFASWMATLFGELHRKLDMTDLYYQTLTIPEHFTLEDTKKFLMRQDYDAFLWFFPQQKFQPLIKDLLDSHLPLTVFGENHLFPHRCNEIVLADHTIFYRHYAEFCKKCNFRSVCLLLWDSKNAEQFRESLKECGIEDFTHIPEIGPELEKAMNGKHFDFIFSPGPVRLQKKILDIIAASPNRDTEIVLSREDPLKELVKNFSFMKITLGCKELTQKLVNDMGERAAKSILRNINRQGE